MDIELISKVTLITLYCFFSVIRIGYYRRTRKSGYRTVIEEKRRYSIWLSLFICYEVCTFFIFIFLPQALDWGALLLPSWTRILGTLLGALALAWFLWIHQALGHNHSTNLRIKDAQTPVTEDPYHWVRHPMYTAFFVLHISAFFLTANWFIGLTWTAGLTAIILLRVRREEEMLTSRFGKSYNLYMGKTGRSIPRVNGFYSASQKKKAA
ncbi:isoprenylcysteine carboxylmethyltransferase family protein [Chloroflexota bacterium]